MTWNLFGVKGIIARMVCHLKIVLSLTFLLSATTIVAITHNPHASHMAALSPPPHRYLHFHLVDADSRAASLPADQVQ
jgi:hypothetical protein